MNNKLLVIGYVWPEPNSSAAGSHMLSLIEAFKERAWDVIFATPAQKTEHMFDLSTIDVKSVSIDINDSSFDDFVCQLSPSVVIFDRFMMEEQFGWRVEKNCPQAIRILDTEDLQFLRNARHEAVKANSPLTEQFLLSDLAKREVAAILRSDLSLIISDFEVALLKEKFNVPAEILIHLPFLLKQNTMRSNLPGYHERHHFVTIGSFRHAPNWDSVLWLHKIWPSIRQQIPKAELHIFGSYPPKKATQLSNSKTGFFVKGWAADAFEVIRQAKVLLSPLRFGAGIKGKFIDAMQVGTPIITTPIGSEGMHGELAWPGFVESTDDLIIKAAVELYTNEASWTYAQTRIAPLLSARYNPDELKQNLFDQVRRVSENLEQHRLNNFYGSMLRFHSMRSTEFMSRWIESKNKLEALK